MSGLFVASNSTALSSQFQLARNMGALGETLTRLSTGLKINSGKDDPAGLIASELLKAQITGTTKAITNTQRANGLIATADSALGQIGNLLNDIKGLTVEAAQTGTMTADQLNANQLQVDAMIQSIDMIARTTSYGGKKVLDGSMGFDTAGSSGGIGNLQINSANFGTASAIGVNTNVTRAADYARLVSNGTGVSEATTLNVTGAKGSSTISLGKDLSNAEIAAAINRDTDSTGVLAYVEGEAARGSVTLSSAGANNDIVIVANEEGLDAGNYTFRITKGDTNDARIVKESANGEPGVVEVTLTEAYEAQYKGFGGLFDISLGTGNASGSTSVTMTRGDKNNVVYNETGKAAASNVIDGRQMTISAASGTKTSAMNGWTVAVDNSIVDAAGNEKIDTNTKTIYVNSASTKDQINTAASTAMAKTLDGAMGTQSPAPAPPGSPATLPSATQPEMELNFVNIDATNALQNGDRYTFSGGADAGEVTITYKEGATANDILGMLNNAPNVQASLKAGVDGNALIKNLPEGQTTATAATSSVSKYTSSATAQNVIDLINNKLGDKFTAAALSGDGTGGRVSFMDAAADYGDINAGNALRFTGMDNGPIVRLTNLGTDGQTVKNQALSVNIIHPSEADIKAGINTPILEVKLATDAQGNSITTASDIANLFDTLTPEQTLGVSVEQLYPPGVDPNGRIFGVDSCGKPYVLDTCPTPVDGIVQPTGAPGVCGPQQGDLILLGQNQTVVEDNAVANISGNHPNQRVATPAAAGADGTFTVSGTSTGTVTDSVFSYTVAPNSNSAVPAVTLAFANGGANIGWNAGTLTLDMSDFDQTTHGASEAAMMAYFQQKVDEASQVGVPPVGAGGITIGIDTAATAADWDTSGLSTPALAVAATANTTDSGAGTAAELASNSAKSGTAAIAAGTTIATNTAGLTTMTFEETSAMNGLTFGFTRDETKEGFDEATGTLMVYLDSTFTGVDAAADAAVAAAEDEKLRIAVNGAIAANWEGIRDYTGATGDAVKLGATQAAPTTQISQEDFVVPTTTVDADSQGFSAANAVYDASKSDAPGATADAGKTKITATNVEGAVIGARGTGKDDPVLTITTKGTGTDEAGIKIHFINDTSRTDLQQWNKGYGTGEYNNSDSLPQLDVELKTNEDGSRELIVTGNLGTQAASEMNAGLLARALNANTEFQKNFTADAAQYRDSADAATAGTAADPYVAGSVQFNKDISKPQGETVGGYRIESGDGVTTSNGASMTGQADSNERLVIESEELGSDQFVKVNVVQGTLNLVDPETNQAAAADYGTDMEATINGITATARGNNLSINTSGLSLSFDAANGVGQSGFTITGGGALLQLGPDVISQQQMRLGINSMLSTDLGGSSGRMFELLSGNVAALNGTDEGRKLADKIVMEAISSVANTRGRLGAIQKGSLESNITALQDSLTALTDADAMITNADFAEESANLTRLQLLIQAGSQTLGIANQLPQYAASLVR